MRTGISAACHAAVFLLLIGLASGTVAQTTAYLGYKPANPNPSDLVVVTVLRTGSGFDPAITPKLYVGFSYTSGPPTVPWVLPLASTTYDPAAPTIFTVALGRLSLPGYYTVRYFDAAEPAPGATPNGVVTIEVKLVVPEKVTVIEFYNAARDHYFMTADPDEIARLDSGATPGWQRTGESFRAYRAGTAPDGIGNPVCRFYGRPEFGLDTHFYAQPGECADVQRKWPAQWVLESANVFEFVYYYSCLDDVPDSQYFYRFFNNRADVNHRYVVSNAAREEMKARGWIPEGYGETATTGCVLK